MRGKRQENVGRKKKGKKMGAERNEETGRERGERVSSWESWAFLDGVLGVLDGVAIDQKYN